MFQLLDLILQSLDIMLSALGLNADTAQSFTPYFETNGLP